MRNLRLYLALGAVAGLIVIVMAFVVASTAIPALRSSADGAAGMQARLEMLKGRLADEQGFQVTFEFDSFIADYNAVQAVPDARSGSVLTVPYRSDNGEVTIALGEIGSDHVCFDEQQGSDAFTRCVMFEQIASVRYQR
jgi:hypothetical protein